MLSGIDRMPRMAGMCPACPSGIWLAAKLAMAGIIWVPFMMPMKTPAASSTEAIISAALAWASTRAR